MADKNSDEASLKELAGHLAQNMAGEFSVEEYLRMKKALNLIVSSISEKEDYDGRIRRVKQIAREGLGLSGSKTSVEGSSPE